MVVTTLTSFTESAALLRQRVDDALKSFVDFEDGCPERLREAIHYSLFAPGKRLRPILVLCAAEACGSDHESALPAACAVEMVHTYSLIHDDLPAMDDDDLRRGQPSSHKVFGDAMAILAGDALLTRAFEVIAEHIRPAEVSARCAACLARAAGASHMVGGQVDDLDEEALSEAIQGPHAEETLISIHRRKTGAMFLASLQLGGHVAGADAAAMHALEGFGTRLGLAFQIVDDLLDISGSEDAIGKRIGKDDARGKLTFPGLLGEKESRRRAAALIEEATADLAPLGPGAENLESLARYVVERDH